MPTGKKKTTTRKATAGAGTKPEEPEPVEPKEEYSGEEATASTDAPTATIAAEATEPKEPEKIPSEPTDLEARVQETPVSPGTGGGDKPEMVKDVEPLATEAAVPSEQGPPPAEAASPEAPAGQAPPAAAAPPEAPASPAPPAAAAPPEEAPATLEPSATGATPQDAPGQEPPATGGEDDFSIFDSQADLEEIFSAMEDVKKEEATAIASAVQAIESGQDATTALQSMSTEVAEKIQKQLEERSAAEEEHFVTEEEFIKHAMMSTAKTWYHCLYFLAFKSETGTASKKVLYEALKETLSKSPVDVMPEHMFNFGLSNLIKIILYEKPVVLFKRGGEFKLDVNRRKLQELLQQVGPPLSKRPIVTKKEEKKMITDFFSDKLF